MEGHDPLMPADEKSETQKKYETILAKLDTIEDGLGEKIDEAIKIPVADLNLFGFNTSFSCGGHYDGEHGGCIPWVYISDPNEPEEQYINEKEIKDRIAKKYGVTPREIESGNAEEAVDEMYRELSSAGLNPEFVAWGEKNKILKKKMEELLEKFYETRNAPDNIRIKIRDIGYEFKIYSGDEDYDKSVDELSEQERAVIKERVEGYRKEMSDFGEFLRKKMEIAEK